MVPIEASKIVFTVVSDLRKSGRLIFFALVVMNFSTTIIFFTINVVCAVSFGGLLRSRYKDGFQCTCLLEERPEKRNRQRARTG